MTKRNLTLGTASGKLGSVVYFRRRGQQIARVLVEQVNDPRTTPQCYVRARFANYVALWRMLRPYIELTWRGVSRYGSTQNAFYTHNTQGMPTASKDMSRLGYAFPCLGLVTYGSLPIAWTYRYEVKGASSSSAGTWAAWIDGLTAFAAPTRIGELSQALISSGLGLRKGDILHFLATTYSYDPANFRPTYALNLQPLVMHAAIALDVDNSTLLSSALSPFEIRSYYFGAGRYEIGFDVNLSNVPQPSGGASLGHAIAIYVERPSNPQHSRYCRSFFVMPDNQLFYLKPMATSVGNVPDQYAATFQSV